MIINLSPQRSDVALEISINGDSVLINGEEFDFSGLPEGATLPQEAIDSVFFIGDVHRIDGELHVTMLLPHGPDAPEERRFPQPIHATQDGAIALPPNEPQESNENEH